MIEATVEDLLRECAPRVLGALVRRYGQFDIAEDAVQEALLAAAQQWPREGVPDNPSGWLTAVAGRRLIDQVRSEHSRRQREERVATEAVPGPADDHDDTLALYFLCCHPALTVPSQLALTLRAVGGLTTAEIAAALLVPEATAAQRISRAKERIRATGARFEMPPAGELSARLGTVLHTLYLIFNEGYTASSGTRLLRTDLTAEAIRLMRALHTLVRDEPEVTGLLALMLLTDARRAARIDADGNLVPLVDQDRTAWNRAYVAEGVALVSAALPRGRLGVYQVQAAIAAVHDEAASAAETDWPQILALYLLLERLAPNPMTTLNRAVAVAEVHGPSVALEMIDELERDGRLARHHRLHAVRAHLLERAGDPDGARDSYRLAARLSRSAVEQRYLLARSRQV